MDSLPPTSKKLPVLKTLNILNYGNALAKAATKKDRVQLRHIKSRLNGAFDLFVL